MWGLASNKTEQACYASTTPIAKPLLFEHDDACILRADDLLRPCGACKAPAAVTAKPPTLLPQISMNEDLQDFGRPNKRRIVYDCGSKTTSVFPSNVDTNVFACDTAHAHTWVSSFQNVTERPVDFISFKQNYLKYYPKSSGTTNHSNNDPGYPLMTLTMASGRVSLGPLG